MTDSFRIVATSQLLQSHVFDVERRVVSHEGETFERDVVVHSGAVAILAINSIGEVGVIRQYRAPFDRFTLEIPAGTQDVTGEAPLETAQRELREELGCLAEHWRVLGRFMNSPGWTDQVMTIFEATGLTTLERSPDGPEERASRVQWLSREDLRNAFAQEDALDSTMAVALNRVFGDLFEQR